MSYGIQFQYLDAYYTGVPGTAPMRPVGPIHTSPQKVVPLHSLSCSGGVPPCPLGTTPTCNLNTDKWTCQRSLPLTPVTPPLAPLGPAQRIPWTPLGPAQRVPWTPLGPAQRVPWSPLGPAQQVPLTPLGPAQRVPWSPLTPAPRQCICPGFPRSPNVVAPAHLSKPCPPDPWSKGAAAYYQTRSQECEGMPREPIIGVPIIDTVCMS
jgi:hypothetical protein